MKEIFLSKESVRRAPNQLWRGLGMVSANNSSRLLLDYKAVHPETYDKLLRLMFGKEGLDIRHLKIEMGSDVNSSSGTEPCTMRCGEESADVTRGAGFILAADAKKINPDLTLDMLWWSEPSWIEKDFGAGDDCGERAGNECDDGESDSSQISGGAKDRERAGKERSGEELYSARYRWYKENLNAAYKKYGLKFDYVSATQNERAMDADWIVYLSRRLKEEKDCLYDFSSIRIVAGEEVCTWNIADEMVRNPALMDAVDVIGSHYTSWSTENAKRLAADKGKQLWLSEGSSPMEYAQGVYRRDGGKGGFAGLNGMLDVACRIITMVSGGDMTLYEFQPVINSYYDGVTYCQKQLINACTPWSGYFDCDLGYFMSLHFAQFLHEGYKVVKSGCLGDGKAAGDGHSIAGAVYNVLSAISPDEADFSTVFCNMTQEAITYHVTMDCLKATAGGEKRSKAYVYETLPQTDPDRRYDENFFKKTAALDLKECRLNGMDCETGLCFDVTVAPLSLVTVSTLDVDAEGLKNFCRCEVDNSVLSLPYSDDFEYAQYGKDFISQRGGSPLYTTDEGGAFEVVRLNGFQALEQQICADVRAKEWGATPDPVTNFGDDRWFNYKMECDVLLAGEGSGCYAGIGVRYNLGDAGQSGLALRVYADGRFELKKNNDVLADGTFDVTALAGSGAGDTETGGKAAACCGAVSAGDSDETGGESAACGHWIRLGISVQDDVAAGFIDGEKVIEINITDAGFAVPSAGRCALYSSYDRNLFAKVRVTGGERPYISRIDNTDLSFDFGEQPEFTFMGSFKHFCRTCTCVEQGERFTFNFKGDAFAVTGLCEEKSEAKVFLDGQEFASYINKGNYRDVLVGAKGLGSGEHKAEVVLTKGRVSVDGAIVVRD